MLNEKFKFVFAFLFPLLLVGCSSKTSLSVWENYTKKPEQWEGSNSYYCLDIDSNQAKSDASAILEQLKDVNFDNHKIYMGESKNCISGSILSTENLFGKANNPSFKDTYGIEFDYDSGEMVISTIFEKRHSESDGNDSLFDSYRFRQTNFYTENKDSEFTAIEYNCANNYVDNSYGAIINAVDSSPEKIDSYIDETRKRISDISWLTEFLENITNDSIKSSADKIEFSHILTKNYIRGDDYAVIFSAKIFIKNDNSNNSSVTKVYNFCPALNMYEVIIGTQENASNDNNLKNDTLIDVYHRYITFAKNNTQTQKCKDKEDLLREYASYSVVDYDIVKMPYLSNNDEETYSSKLANYFGIA